MRLGDHNQHVRVYKSELENELKNIKSTTQDVNILNIVKTIQDNIIVEVVKDIAHISSKNEMKSRKIQNVGIQKGKKQNSLFRIRKSNSQKSTTRYSLIEPKKFGEDTEVTTQYERGITRCVLWTRGYVMHKR